MSEVNKNSVRMEYFSASWCQPCKSMTQPIAELQADGWYIEKIDIDQDDTKAVAAGIRSIPAFVIYKNNIRVRQFVGVKSKTFLEEALNVSSKSSEEESIKKIID